MARVCNAYNLVDNRRPMLSLVFLVMVGGVYVIGNCWVNGRTRRCFRFLQGKWQQNREELKEAARVGRLCSMALCCATIYHPIQCWFYSSVVVRYER